MDYINYAYYYLKHAKSLFYFIFERKIDPRLTLSRDKHVTQASNLNNVYLNKFSEIKYIFIRNKNLNTNQLINDDTSLLLVQ